MLKKAITFLLTVSFLAGALLAKRNSLFQHMSP